MYRTKRNLGLMCIAILCAVLSAACSLSVFSYVRADETSKTDNFVKFTEKELEKIDH